MTTPRTLPWSFSALQSFEACALKHAEMKVWKRIKDGGGGEALVKGRVVHKAFEDYAKFEKPLPGTLSHWQKSLDFLLGFATDKVVEHKMAITPEEVGCDWWAKDVWLRAVTDLTIYNRNNATAITVDYKTGKVREDLDQLKIVNWVVLANNPWMEKAISQLWFVEHTNQIRTVTTLRSDVAAIWAELEHRYDTFRWAVEQEKFPANPGRHCSWCPVTSCPFFAEGEGFRRRG